MQQRCCGGSMATGGLSRHAAHATVFRQWEDAMGYGAVRALGLGIAFGVTACGGSSLHATPVVITLTPLEVASKVSRHYEFSGLFCDFQSMGTGPVLQPNPNDLDVRAIVGWDFAADYGTDPLPCAYALRHDYIAAIYFDVTPLLREGGIVASAELRFRRSDTPLPIDVSGWGSSVTMLYALDPWEDWVGGYHSGDETDPDANPPASLLYGGVPYGPIAFMNSADPMYSMPFIDVTNLISTAMTSRGTRWHGILLSPRRNPMSLGSYLDPPLIGFRPTHGSCTGLFSDFELKVTLVHIE
jgi:hypothetical protein